MFQSPVEFSTASTGTQRNGLVVGDFNGDGKMDLAAIVDQPQDLNLVLFLRGAHPANTPDPPSLVFNLHPIGTTSGPQTIALTNTGTASLTKSSIALTGVSAGNFAKTNTCWAHSSGHRKLPSHRDLFPARNWERECIAERDRHCSWQPAGDQSIWRHTTRSGCNHLADEHPLPEPIHGNERASAM
jgi:hypothetical protein